MAFLSDATNRESDSTALEDLDYDEFLSEPEIAEIAVASCKNPPPGITVTVHLDNNPKMIIKTEHHQQLGDSFDYSNSDLHNVINIGRNTKTVIINKKKIMRKSKPTVQHLITEYLISTGIICEYGIATRQHLLLNQSSQ